MKTRSFGGRSLFASSVVVVVYVVVLFYYQSMRVFNKSNLESILKTTNGEREDLSGEREKCTRDDPFSFLFSLRVKTTTF